MKKKISKTLLYIHPRQDPSWKDIKNFPFEDDDLIICQWEEPFYSENNSYDGGWVIAISRDVEETGEEYKKRLEREESQKKEIKERRYQNYLNLKKEFENDNK